MDDVLSSKTNYISAIIAIEAIAFLLFIYLIKYIREQQKLIVKIIKIYYWSDCFIYCLNALFET